MTDSSYAGKSLGVRRRLYNKAGKKLADSTFALTHMDAGMADRLYTEGVKELRVIHEDGAQVRYTRAEVAVCQDDGRGADAARWQRRAERRLRDEVRAFGEQLGFGKGKGKS